MLKKTLIRGGLILAAIEMSLLYFRSIGAIQWEELWTILTIYFVIWGITIFHSYVSTYF